MNMRELRANLEQQVARLQGLEEQRLELNAELQTLLEQRKSLKSTHILMRDQISTIREEVAAELQREAGERVRIRIMRNADDLAYQQMLIEGTQGREGPKPRRDHHVANAAETGATRAADSDQ